MFRSKIFYSSRNSNQSAKFLRQTIAVFHFRYPHLNVTDVRDVNGDIENCLAEDRLLFIVIKKKKKKQLNNSFQYLK